MPHQCTECGRVFPDGSKEMLSGCPDCGGNTFQFKPEGAVSGDDGSSDATPPESPGSDSTVTGTVSRATRTVREWVSDGPDVDPSSDGDPEARSGEGAGVGRADATPDLGPSEDEEYSEWPNPDGADTSGVGKGPSARRRRDAGTSDRSIDESAREGESVDEEDRRPASSRGASSGDEFEWTEDPVTDETSVEGSPDSDHHPRQDPDWETDRIRARPDDREDDAQADARSDMVTSDELPGPTGAGGAGPDSPDQSDLDSPDQPPSVEGPDDGRVTENGDREATTGDSEVGAPSERSAPSPPPNDPEPAGSPEADTPSDGRVVDSPSSEGRPDLEDLREELNDQFESIKIVSPGQYELNLMELYDRDEYIISLREDGRYVIEVAESWRNDDE
ncbi:MAG: putative nucleic acid-binding Zn-ribbon protein [Halobacteriales archaeon]|jgi:predicted  nucleic acid-binding Zn-ribbon protein